MSHRYLYTLPITLLSVGVLCLNIYLTIKAEIDVAIAEVIRTSAFIRGPFVERFEEEYAEVMEAKHCVSCADGTAALQIAMHALGLRPGDEVVIHWAPEHTFGLDVPPAA